MNISYIHSFMSDIFIAISLKTTKNGVSKINVINTMLQSIVYVEM